MEGGAIIPPLSARWSPRPGHLPHCCPGAILLPRQRRVHGPGSGCLRRSAPMALGPPIPASPRVVGLLPWRHTRCFFRADRKAPCKRASNGCSRRGRPKGPSGGGCARACFLPEWFARIPRCAAGTGRPGRRVGLSLPPMRSCFCAPCPRTCFLPRQRSAGS